MASAPPAPTSTESLEVRVITAENINPGGGQPDFDAYVKVEMRGQDGLVKARTAAGKWMEDGSIKFDETLRLPIPAGAEEIRLKVCKDKKRVFLSGSNVISNAGIYLRDLLRFVPIEKEFGLFRPTDKTPGGSIKMFFDYKPNTPAETVAAPAKATEQATPQGKASYTAKEPAAPKPAVAAPPPANVTISAAAKAAAAPSASSGAPAKKKGGFPLLGLLVVVAGAGCAVLASQQQKTKKPAPKKK